MTFDERRRLEHVELALQRLARAIDAGEDLSSWADWFSGGYPRLRREMEADRSRRVRNRMRHDRLLKRFGRGLNELELLNLKAELLYEE